METTQNKIKNNKGEVFIFIALIFIVLPFIFVLSVDWLRNSVLDKFLDLFLLSKGIYFSSVLLCLIFSILALINNKKSRDRMAIITLAIIFIIWNILFLFFNILSILPRRNVDYDVSNKADLSSLRAAGEFYYAGNEPYGSYTGFCGSQDAMRAAQSIEANESELVCNDSEKEWAACAQGIRNHQKTENYFCVDSTGFAKEIEGQCDANWKYTKCPANSLF